jgi:hypothetical protein
METRRRILARFGKSLARALSFSRRTLMSLPSRIINKMLIINSTFTWLGKTDVLPRLCPKGT